MDIIVQKSYYYFVKTFIEDHNEILSNRRIIIYGAGTQGCCLFKILKKFGYNNIFFADNDPKKWNKKIDDHVIVSPKSVKVCKGEDIFLCPSENNGSIINELKSSGLEENVDFFNLHYILSDYKDIIKNLNESKDDYSLLMMGCSASPLILSDNGEASALGDIIKEKIFDNSTKLYTLRGISMRLYYQLICIEIQKTKKYPKFLVMYYQINTASSDALKSFTPSMYMQIQSLCDQLLLLAPNDKELQEYKKINDELLLCSKQRAVEIKNNTTASTIKDIYELKYNYTVDENDESIVYAKKILNIMNRNNVPVVILIPPVDFMTAKEVCDENFFIMYKELKEKINYYLREFKYEYIDLSFIANTDCFVKDSFKVDVNHILNIKGQNLFIDFIKKQKDIIKLVGDK